MNWNKIDKSWYEFAEFYGVELNYTERNLFHSIECKYSVKFSTDYGNSVFKGVLWKTQDGHNRNRTKISTQFKSEKILENLEIKPSGIKSLLVKNNRTDFEKEIAQNLKNQNGKKLILINNILEIELNGILSTKSDFDKVNKLITKIKNSN